MGYKKTKIYINTLSPMGLVSPRFFENMASRAMVFCEESDVYKRIFSRGCYVCFKSDLSDFEETMSYYLSNETQRNEVVERGYAEVMKNHTWEKRISFLIDKIREIG